MYEDYRFNLYAVSPSLSQEIPCTNQKSQAKAKNIILCELERAISNLKNEKNPGFGNICTQKYIKGGGMPLLQILLCLLHELMNFMNTTNF